MTNRRRLSGRSVDRSRRMPMGAPRRAIRLLSALSYALLVTLGLITAVEAQEDDARCEGRVVTLVGTAGDDCLPGTEGDDVIHGMGGDDLIGGFGGNDTICGGHGSDLWGQWCR